MAVVYFYIPVEKVKDVIECGLKLSEYRDRAQQTPWNSYDKACLVACLHPHDDIRHKDPAWQCITLDIPIEYCTVADKDLYILGQECPDMCKAYIDSMVPLSEYLFGSFRKPECLVFTTVLSEQIRCLGKGRDEPILYESSEFLYVSNLHQKYFDRYDDINEVLLYCLFTLQEQEGIVTGYLSQKNGLAAFFDKEGNKHITVSIPDIKNYRLY